MFSKVSGFLPTNIFRNIYATVLETLDLNVELVSPKQMREAAFDKAFWAAHYTTVIEELAENATQKNSTEQTLASLKERLLECQGMIGRHTLSPRYYEKGIQDLIVILLEENELAAVPLSCIAMLNGIRSDFEKSLIEQRDFTKECFMGDADHLVGQWKAGKIGASDFSESIVYYAEVMPVSDYYDGLRALKSYFQANVGFDPLTKAINQLLLTVDRFEVEQSRQVLRAEQIADVVLASEAVIPEVANSTIRISNTAQKSSFLDRFWQAGSGVISYIITHPLQAVTAGLAAQSSAVMAGVVLPTATPLASPRSAIMPSLLKANELAFRLSDSQAFFNIETQNTAFGLKENLLLEMKHSAPPEAFLEVAVSKSSLKAIQEFQVNTYTHSGQYNPSVSALTDGGFVVTWQSDGQDGNGFGVYGQRYDVTGVPIGDEFRINTYTNNYQTNPSVAALAHGGFVVTWQSGYGQDGSDYGVYGRQYNTVGVPGNEFQVNTYINDAQAFPSVAALANGGFIVTWQSYLQDGSSWGTYGRRYSVGGIPGTEFLVNTYTSSDQSMPSVAAFANGGFVVIWHSYDQDGSGYGIYGRQYDVDGIPGNEFRVNTYVAGSQQFPSVVVLTNGTFVVTWQSDGQDGTWDIYAQHYDATGSTIGNEFRVNTDTVGNQFQARISALANGGFVVTWASDSLDGNVWSIYGQCYNPRCEVINPAFQANNYSPIADNRSNPRVSGLASGGFVVTWESVFQDGSNLGVYGRRYMPPVLQNNIFSINQGQSLVLNSAMLSASDVDVDTTLTFMMSSVQNGHFELLSNAGISVIHFTQEQIADGQVRFVHTGGQNSPSYQVAVSDGILSTEPVTATIHFNASPILVDNTLTINQGQTTVLNSNNLQATDLDNDAALLTFTVSNVQNGRFRLASNPSVVTTSFSQQKVSNGQVLFTHTGAQNVPGYAVSVSDGATTTDPVEAIMHFNANPVLINNALRVSAGQAVIVTRSDLSATGGLDSDPSTVVFTVSDLQNGYFELVSNQGIAIASFTQQQVNERQVQFTHTGGENAPGYKISVSNGVVTTPPSFATIDFDFSNPTHTPSSPGKSNESQCGLPCQIVLSVASPIVAAAIVGAFTYFRKRHMKNASAEHTTSKVAP